MKKYIFLLIFGFAFFYSCTTDQDLKCLPYRVYYNGSLRYQFTHGENDRLEMVEVFDGQGILFQYYVVIWNGDKIDYVDAMYPFGMLDSRRVCSYDPDGRLNVIYTMINTNPDNIPDDFLGKFELFYNASGELDSVAEYDNSMNYEQSFLMEWADGNLTKLLNTLTGTYSIYSYDTYPSFYSYTPWENFLIFNFWPYMSSNNLIHYENYDASNTLLGENTIDFYYANGLPDSSSNGFRFVFNCVE